MVFKVPPRKKMAALGKALAAMPSVIDAVGAYKMSAETKRRAEDRRRKVGAVLGGGSPPLPPALFPPNPLWRGVRTHTQIDLHSYLNKRRV